MTTKVERSIRVEVPVRTAYDQWTQFEDFPHFMGGVKEVRQLDDRRLHWTAEIAGVRREWEASVLEQVPDSKVAWAATSGATNAGAVRFEADGPDATTVHLTLEYEPEGLVEQAGDKLGVVERQVTSDLERFKALVEDQGYASGAWRGEIPGSGVGIPRVGAAAASEGDSGKAGVSAKVVAGAAAAAGGLAVAAPLTPYPPGIPLVLPGEVLSAALVRTVQAFLAEDVPVRGLVQNLAGALAVSCVASAAAAATHRAKPA